MTERHNRVDVKGQFPNGDQNWRPCHKKQKTDGEEILRCPNNNRSMTVNSGNSGMSNNTSDNNPSQNLPQAYKNAT